MIRMNDLPPRLVIFKWADGIPPRSRSAAAFIRVLLFSMLPLDAATDDARARFAGVASESTEDVDSRPDTLLCAACRVTASTAALNQYIDIAQIQQM